MKKNNKVVAAALFASLLGLVANVAVAQAVGGSSTSTTTSQQDGATTGSASNAQVSGITASNSVGNDAHAQSGGNVFDFSNKGQPMGYAPSLPSFAGGPCMGVSGGISASLPGFGIGGGRSFEDVSCQRRNWVQTLIGAAERMPDVEARELKRVAIVVMMQDPILGPAFRDLGYNVDNPGTEVSSAKGNNRSPVQTASGQTHHVKSSVGSMAQVCTAVVPKGASAGFIKLVESRGCVVSMR